MASFFQRTCNWLRGTSKFHAEEFGTRCTTGPAGRSADRGPQEVVVPRSIDKLETVHDERSKGLSIN